MAIHTVRHLGWVDLIRMFRYQLRQVKKGRIGRVVM